MTKCEHKSEYSISGEKERNGKENIQKGNKNKPYQD